MTSESESDQGNRQQAGTPDGEEVDLEAGHIMLLRRMLGDQVMTGRRVFVLPDRRLAEQAPEAARVAAKAGARSCDDL